MKILRPISLLVILTLVLAACGGSGASGPPVRIGSKDFTEELLLGEMYALILEDKGIPVERRLNLAGTQVAHEALVRGDIDVYPEYTGTGYLFILDIKDDDKDPQVVYQKAAQGYKDRWNVIWLDPAPMNNTNAIAVTQQAAQQYNLRTLSDLAQAAPSIRFAGIPDFEQRPDGLAGLKEVYGGFEFKELTVYDPGLKYKAITDGQADAVIAFSTDGQISAYNLVLMEDDKGLWPPYQVAPVVRAEVLDRYPAMRDALNKLAPLLTNEVLSSLNWRVDGEKQEYTTVAKAFLQEKGLIQ
jgi:osmoprotectant transport system substrate-binding protein